MPASSRRRAALVSAVCGVLAVAACSPQGTGLGLTLVPDQQVEAMGAETWQQIRAETPASSNGTFQRRAEQVAERILTAAGKTPEEWEVVVFQGAERNAFALPNKKIGVYDGMMELVSGPDELAAVIGHEVAHVEERHATERVNTQVATQTGVQIASSAAGAAGVSPEIAAGILGAGAQYGLTLPYSRNQELEADERGLVYMARAGYDPKAAVSLWKKMQDGPSQPSFLSTHPAPQERIARLQQQIAQMQGQ